MPQNLARLLGYVGPSPYIGICWAGEEMVLQDGTIGTTSVAVAVWQLFEQHPFLSRVFREVRFHGTIEPPEEILLIRVSDGALFVAPYQAGLDLLIAWAAKNRQIPRLPEQGGQEEMAETARKIAQERLAPVSEEMVEEARLHAERCAHIRAIEMANPQNRYC